MSDPATPAFLEPLGLTGWGVYYAGRCGVLGDVEPDVVVAAAAFIPAHSVARGWGKARANGRLAEAVTAYAQACAAWGRTHLQPVVDAGRLAELLQRVVEAASPVNAPLFAGWRCVPLPDDVHGRLALLLHVARELRAARHAVAVQASGLTPLEATATSPKLAQVSLQLFDWPKPWPEPDEALLARRRAADELTEQLHAADFECLDEAERTELVALAVAAKRAVYPPRS